MKRIVIAISLLMVLLSGILSGCTSNAMLLSDALQDYTAVVNGELPEDLSLTIYYLRLSIVTRMPLTSEDLVNLSHTEKIVVESSELVAYQDLLQKMNASALQPSRTEPLVDARLYYVFSTGANDKLLEVTISGGPLDSRDPIVNGIHVEDNDVLYELIAPFLSEEVRDMFGF